MSNDSTESDSGEGIGDDQLPEDLRPDENPLAQPLEPGETAGDLEPGELLEEGKTDDSQDSDGDEEDDSDDED